MLLELNTSRRVVILSLARSIESFGISFLIVILPIYIGGGQVTTGFASTNLFGLDITVELLIGVALSMAALISSLGQPFGGSLSDKSRRPKFMIIIGLSLLAVTIPLYIISTSYWHILVLRFIQGLSGALVIPAVALMINEASVKENRGENFGVYNTLRLIGFGLGPIVAGLIIDLGPYSILKISISGVDAAFWFAMLTSAIAIILVIVFVEELETDEISTESDQSAFDLIKSDKFRPVIALSVTTFLLASSIAVFATLENVIIERFDQTSFMFGIQFSAAVLANTLVQTPVGRLSDRRGRRIFIMFGFILLIPSVILQGFVQTSTQLLLARLVQGVAVAMVFAPSLALVGDMATEKRSGLYLSFVTGSFGMGIAVGPTISGLLYSLGGFSLPFVFSGVISIVGLILVILYVEDL